MTEFIIDMKGIIRSILYNATLLYHSICGLDFIRKDTTVHNKYNNGYGFTDRNQIKIIVNFIKTKRLDSLLDNFLDVGCGKGYVLAQMVYRNNVQLAGIECVPHLASIAYNNFKRMKIDNRISIYLKDALEFKDYANYSTLFMYNPFPKEIMTRFIKKVIEAKTGQEYLIIYIHPQYHEEIMQTGHFALIGSFYGKFRPQLINIYYSSPENSLK